MGDKEKAIDERRKEWILAVNAGNVENYLSILSENIVWFPPDGQVINGKEDFRDWVEPFFQNFDYDFSVSQTKIKVIEDWAIERGEFASKLTPKTNREMMEHSGKYIIFWHREKNDDWKLERYVDNSQS